MRPRPWHRWSAGLLGPHRPTGVELAMPQDPTVPRLLACDCRWVLAVDVGWFLEASGFEVPADLDRLVWAPRWVLEDAFREVW
jgi:hypothetical protein